MKHASLFSGIGGFDLAAEWAGWENVFHCEWNPFGQKVLKHHFPNSISYHDITKTDFKVHANEIDILTGGFPCQPYSSAGKRLGKADERHLFPEMLRCIKEVKPRWIIGENVRGLVSWGGELVFEEVHADLEREGYEVQAFIIPAASVNAPHKRERIWFVAHSVCKGYTRPTSGRIQEMERRTAFEHNKCSRSGERNDWLNFPTQPFVCGGDDGIPVKLDSITFPKWRRESIKAYGNAIVPQVAYQIFKTINQIENEKRNQRQKAATNQ